MQSRPFPSIFIWWRCRDCGTSGASRAMAKTALTMPLHCAACASADLIRQSTMAATPPDWMGGEISNIPGPRDTTPEERGELRCHVLDDNGECARCGCARTRECSGVPMPASFKSAVLAGHADYFNFKEQWAP